MRVCLHCTVSCQISAWSVGYIISHLHQLWTKMPSKVLNSTFNKVGRSTITNFTISTASIYCELLCTGLFHCEVLGSSNNDGSWVNTIHRLNFASCRSGFGSHLRSRRSSRLCSVGDSRRSVVLVTGRRRRRPNGLRRCAGDVPGGTTSPPAWWAPAAAAAAARGVVNRINSMWSPTTLLSVSTHGSQRNTRRNPLRNLTDRDRTVDHHHCSVAILN